jgi:hypothetical protein
MGYGVPKDDIGGQGGVGTPELSGAAKLRAPACMRARIATGSDVHGALPLGVITG